MNVIRSRVLAGHYVDSVLLMRLAQRLEQLDGVERAAAMMGTEANKTTLSAGGFLTADTAGARADDLVVAVVAAADDAAQHALERIESILAEHRRGRAENSRFRTIDAAVEEHPDLNLALISVPGEYAGREARRALEAGLHTMIFSSNVPLEVEVTLKQLALSRGLLCMGPDCGTAVIGGVGLAFSNVVRRGPVGVVGASGTGTQAITSMLDRLGVGISHAIGCGSRDLSEEVGAITTLQGIDALDADTSTRAILVVSKPPAPSVAARVRERARRADKPVICCFLGDPEGPQTLADAAVEVARAAGHDVSVADLALYPPLGMTMPASLSSGQRYLRGLFAGGTLAYEAQLMMRAYGVEVFSNAPLPGGHAPDDSSRSRGHAILDLGSEELTRGRPHPMIDSRLRRERLLQEARDPEVRVLLLDIILGYGAAQDPAGDLAGAIGQGLEIARAAGRDLTVIASVVGTERDPQGLLTQIQRLRSAGAVVTGTSAAAAALTVSLLPGIVRSPAEVLL